MILKNLLNKWFVFALTLSILTIVTATPAPAMAQTNTSDCASVIPIYKNPQHRENQEPIFTFDCVKATTTTVPNLFTPIITFEVERRTSWLWHLSSTPELREWAKDNWAANDGCSMAEAYNWMTLTGPGGRQVTPSVMFNAACIEHDYCYTIYRIGQHECDNRFHHQMNAICDAVRDWNGCHDVAWLMGNAVKGGGIIAYNDSQAVAEAAVRAGTYPCIGDARLYMPRCSISY